MASAPAIESLLTGVAEGVHGIHKLPDEILLKIFGFVRDNEPRS
jgi:hypothetical protein